MAAVSPDRFARAAAAADALAGELDSAAGAASGSADDLSRQLSAATASEDPQTRASRCQDVAEAAVRRIRDLSTSAGALRRRQRDLQELTHQHQTLVSRGLVGEVADDGELRAAKERVLELEDVRRSLEVSLSDAEHRQKVAEESRLEAVRQKNAKAEQLRSVVSVARDLLSFPPVAKHADPATPAREETASDLAMRLDTAVRRMARDGGDSPTVSESTLGDGGGEEGRRRLAEVEKYLDGSRQRVESMLASLREQCAAESFAVDDDAAELPFLKEQTARLGPLAAPILSLQRCQRRLIRDWQTARRAPAHADGAALQRLEDACAEVTGEVPSSDAAGDADGRLSDCILHLETFVDAERGNLVKAVRYVDSELARAGEAEEVPFTVDRASFADLVVRVGSPSGVLMRAGRARGGVMVGREQTERRFAAARAAAANLAEQLQVCEPSDQAELEEIYTQVHSRVIELLEVASTAAEEKTDAREHRRALGSLDGLLSMLLQELEPDAEMSLDPQEKALRLHAALSGMKSKLAAVADKLQVAATGESTPVAAADPDQLLRLAEQAEKAAMRMRSRLRPSDRSRRPAPPPPLQSPRADPELASALRGAAAAAESAVDAVPMDGRASSVSGQPAGTSPVPPHSENRSDLQAKLERYKKMAARIQESVGMSPVPGSPTSMHSAPSPGAVMERYLARQPRDITADDQLGEVADEIGELLPTAEAIAGAPPPWEALEVGEPGPDSRGADKLRAVLVRWRRLGTYYSEARAVAGSAVERAQPQTLSRDGAKKLRAALSRCGHYCQPSDDPADAAAAATDAACAALDRLSADRTQLIGALEELCAGAGDEKRAGPQQRRGITDLAERVRSSVLQLRAHCSGVEMRVTQLRNAVLAATQDVDKVLADPARQGSRELGTDDAPEKGLQRAVAQLRRRAAPHHGRADGESHGPMSRLHRLAPGAHADTDVITSIEERLEELDQDRKLARKEGEWVKSQWRTLNDTITRLLRPLLRTLPPTRRPQDDPDASGVEEGGSAADVVQEVHDRITADRSRLQKVANERDGEKARRTDYEQRLRRLQRQQSAAAGLLADACERAELAVVPGKAGVCDVVETTRAVTEALAAQGELVARVHTAERAARMEREGREREGKRVAKVEHQWQELRNLVREALHALRLLPPLRAEEGQATEDADWSALCAGMEMMAGEVRRAVRAESRIARCDDIVGKLVGELSGYAHCDPDVGSPSPLPPRARAGSSTDEDGVGVTPSCRLSPSAPLISPQRHTRKSPPPPGSSPRDVPPSPPPPDAVLEKRCAVVLARFRGLQDAADEGARARRQVLAVDDALRDLLTSGEDAPQQVEAGEGVAAAVHAVRASVERLRVQVKTSQEVAAAATAEKARAVREACSLRTSSERADALSAEVQVLRDGIREVEAQRDDLAARVDEMAPRADAAATFARYACDIVRDVGGDPQGQDLSPELVEQVRLAWRDLRHEALEAKQDAEERVAVASDALSGVAALLEKISADAAAAEAAVGCAPEAEQPDAEPVAPIYSLASKLRASVRRFAAGAKTASAQSGKVLHCLRELCALSGCAVHQGAGEAPALKQLSRIEHVTDTLLRSAHIRTDGGKLRSLEPPDDPRPVDEAAREPLAAAVELLEGLLGGPRVGGGRWSDGGSVDESFPSDAGTPRGARTSTALAARCATLAGALDAELRLMCRSGADRGVVSCLRAEIGASLLSRTREVGADVVEGVHGIVRQLHNLASSVAAAPPAGCNRLLMQAAKPGKQPKLEVTDPLGLTAAFRRLLAVIANKRCSAGGGKDAVELRAQCEALRGEVRALGETLQQKDHTVRRAEQAEKQAKSLLDMNKDQWAAARRQLDDKAKALDAELRRVTAARDAAQSDLALSRHHISTMRRLHPRVVADAIAEAGEPALSGGGVALSDLEGRLEQAEKERREATEYAGKLYERLEQRELQRKETKRRLRQAEREIAEQRQEQERQRASFSKQLDAVRDDVLKMRGGGVAWSTSVRRAVTAPLHPGSPTSASKVSPPPPLQPADDGPRNESFADVARVRSVSALSVRTADSGPIVRAASSPRPRGAPPRQPPGAGADLTVPGCFCCDSPDGPSRYSSGSPRTVPRGGSPPQAPRGSRGSSARREARSGAGSDLRPFNPRVLSNLGSSDDGLPT
eukprot:TRINITY_DN9932_c1_g1_i3.p1 TRINITY_DN9932_c1_g1~~TRINITY_DN9932_c1_g1_i3.p1  ORF type:complete len:2169 (+),score=786.44 TRINITY_DN9932_c1_g1_i3:136-6642(+)